ncbi:hypothetical protein GALMADRAFT_222340 [Galerina marginata CBS 339.88]|uniref:F-box domain-containing protein n=1 Tax=Galerina marginata (strain CBS 339.88) TaxID=685588 RepID=A0A067TLD8_GALM3|nr:hypothetical protein GALMADRAFT_222340 [Galerina marginata CBS 339.88]
MALPALTFPGDDASISSLVNQDTTMQDAFWIIDQEVNKYQTYIVTLWRGRNSCAPISRLPPEMLCKIFDFTSRDETRGSLHWIKVSHVCHAWRNIAVNSPSLWTNLPVTNARWTEEMLSRSKMAGLTVKADFLYSYRKSFDATVASALQHTLRIQHLSLSNGNAGVIQKLLSGLPKSAPRLESLCVHVTHQRPMYVGASKPDEICELPETVLSGVDCLRRLEVTRCKVNWNSHRWSFLTYLKIHDAPLAFRLTRTQLVAALKRMPLLESLDLQETLLVTGDSEQPLEKIFLAHLAMLTIASSTPQVQMFLKSILFLPTVILTVICKPTGTSGSDFSGVLSEIASIISPSTKSPGLRFRTLEVLRPSTGSDGLQFKAYTTVASDMEATYGHIKPSLDVSLIHSMTMPATAEKIFKDVCEAISLGNVVNLHLLLSHGVGFTTRILAETFGQLDHLRSVCVTGVCSKEFTRALQEIQANQNLKKSRNPLLYFCNLRSISMRDVTFDEDRGDLTIEALQDCLIWRYECGVEILDLKIEDCYGITETNVFLLEDIVVNLEWDGVELELSDEEDNGDEDEDSDSENDSDLDNCPW